MKQSVFLLLILSSIKSFAQEDSWKYLNQTPPGDIPEVFAPGIVSTKMHEHSSPIFTQNGDEIYWSVIREHQDSIFQDIWYVKYQDGKWTSPKIASFSGKHYEGGPKLTPDNKHLYIYRSKPVPNNSNSIHITDVYLLERDGDNFKVTSNLEISKTIAKSAFSHSITNSGAIYFDGESKNIYKIEKDKPSKYNVVSLLHSNINSNAFDWTPFIATDESYIIFSSSRNPEKNGNNWGDLYMSFKINNNEWSEAFYMGDEINTSAQERFPSVSPDGKFLFFLQRTAENRDDVFWVSASIIDD